MKKEGVKFIVKWKVFYTISLIAIISIFINLSFNTQANALESGAREKALSKNGQVHKDMYEKIKKNLNDYNAMTEFTLSRYVPRDSTDKEWLNEKLSAPKISTSNGGKTYATHFFDRDGKSYLFTLSVERAIKTEKAMKKTGAKIEQKKRQIGSIKDVDTYTVEIDKPLTYSEKAKLLPLGCSANVQYAGNPIQGSFGTIDWGNIAGDVNMAHKYFKRNAEIFVEHYGFGKVTDQGGAIKGNRIDLFVDDCDDALKGGMTPHSTVVFKKSDGVGIPNQRQATKEDLDKIMKSKKWGDNNSSGDFDSGEKENTESSDNSSSNYKSWSPFEKTSLAKGAIVGVDKNEAVVPSELSYTTDVWVKIFAKLTGILMTGIILLIIVFYSLQIAYVALLTRGVVNDGTEKIRNIVYGKNANITADNYMKELLLNGLIIVVMIALVASSYYAIGQQQIYAGIEYILNYLF